VIKKNARFSLTITSPHSSLACFIYPFLRFVLSLICSLLALPLLVRGCVCLHACVSVFVCIRIRTRTCALSVADCLVQDAWLDLFFIVVVVVLSLFFVWAVSSDYTCEHVHGLVIAKNILGHRKCDFYFRAPLWLSLPSSLSHSLCFIREDRFHASLTHCCCHEPPTFITKKKILRRNLAVSQTIRQQLAWQAVRVRPSATALTGVAAYVPVCGCILSTCMCMRVCV